MKKEMKELYDMNISFIGENNPDHQKDENFMKLWKKVGEKYFDKKKT